MIATGTTNEDSVESHRVSNYFRAHQSETPGETLEKEYPFVAIPCFFEGLSVLIKCSFEGVSVLTKYAFEGLSKTSEWK